VRDVAHVCLPRRWTRRWTRRRDGSPPPAAPDQMRLANAPAW